MLAHKYGCKGWLDIMLFYKIFDLFPYICLNILSDFPAVYYSRICDLGKLLHQVTSLVRDRELPAQLKDGSLYFLYFFCIFHVTESFINSRRDNYHFFGFHSACCGSRGADADAARDERAPCLERNGVLVHYYSSLAEFSLCILSCDAKRREVNEHQVVVRAS